VLRGASASAESTYAVRGVFTSTASTAYGLRGCTEFAFEASVTLAVGLAVDSDAGSSSATAPITLAVDSAAICSSAIDSATVDMPHENGGRADD